MGEKGGFCCYQPSVVGRGPRTTPHSSLLTPHSSLPTPHSLLLTPYSSLLTLAVVLALLPVGLSQPPTEETDPLAIRWVAIPPERLPQELERVRQGSLVRMARADFEAHLRRPRLVQAQFQGHLAGSSLTGTGSWQILQPRSGPGVLPLQPLNLALRQPRFVNAPKQEVLLAEFDGQVPGLLIGAAGEHQVTFSWSLRGDPDPEGMLFHLEVPPCALASLELDLPQDAIVNAGGCMVTGPIPGETAEHSLWKINFSRRPTVDVRIKRLTSQPGVAPLIVARRLESDQTLGQDVIEANYVFDLEVLRGRVQELTCECDTPLRPYEVVAPDLEKWEVKEAPLSSASPPGSGGGSVRTTLSLRWRKPFQSTSVVVRCVAPRVPPKVGPASSRPGVGRLEAGPTSTGGSGNDASQPFFWTSPGLRLLNVVPRGETLTLHVPPEITLADWQPGGFQISSMTSDARGQVLRLVGGLLEEPAGTGARPGARLLTSGPEYRIRQLTWWQVSPERSLLTTQIKCEVLRGRLFRLPLLLPPRYEVERVDLNPPEQLRSWEVHQERGMNSLTVNLQQPIAPPRATTRVRLATEPRRPTFVPSPEPWISPYTSAIRLRIGSREKGPR